MEGVMNGKDLRTIKSAHRVLEILEYFDREHRTATVMDLSRSLAYPQSSTSELLRCLTRLGYLHYNRFRRTYSPTARVALLGSWVEPTLFRGGTVLTALDRVADAVGETVVLSTAANYLVHHLHVVDGLEEGAAVEHAGNTDSLMHSPQGRLILASYKDEYVRSALHRLNAEEEDPERRVRINETIDELKALRSKGWVVQPDARSDGMGAVCVILPPRRGMERLVLTVLASREIVEARGEEILNIMLEQREDILPEAEVAPSRAETPGIPLHRAMDRQPIYA
jgi:IclR family KDG regulon transcriptional repressor